MARTKEEIRDLVSKIQEHPNFDVLADLTEDHICEELEIRAKKLFQAIIDDDIDGVIAAFTGWDAEGLLFGENSPLHRFVQTPRPPKEGVPVHTPPADGKWQTKDYTWEFCPECDTEQVIYSKGITACPNCGAPLAPCSCCEDGCNYETCPYGCTGGEEDSYKAVTNPPISKEEQRWFAEQDALLTPSPTSNAEEDSPFANVPEEPIYECPWHGIDFGFNCPFSGHGICSEPSGPCNGPSCESSDEDDICDSAGDPLENPDVLKDTNHLFQCVSDVRYNFHVIAIDLADALATASTWNAKQFPNSEITKCFRVSSYVAECQDSPMVLVSDAYKMQFPEALSEDLEDDEDSDFECCYDCSQCEINGSCERQEHLSEVDSEVDAL